MFGNYRNIFCAGVFIILELASCTGNKTDAKDSDTVITVVESYHADNDIAMTVRSIVDAIKVGEPLDTLDYNFEGILTDGQGHPLYTDIQGAPGEWEVDVLSPTSAVIRNLYLGDLLPDDLESYLAQSLNLNDSDIVETEEYDDDESTSLVVYDFDGGFLRIETRAGMAPNGLEGPLVSIIATKKTPEKAGA